MTGFTTDYVNQIATNLRDRYRSGFPILKELVQNADDAGARALAIGYHEGHGRSADHMLLAGPALWFLNDGHFKPSDRAALRSFGLNAKAGDAGVIGKFGLGMKSVFHLCESFFYLASDGTRTYQEILNPWHSEDFDCADVHRSWEVVTERDWSCLGGVAREQPEAVDGRSWFLLWVPLRQHAHIPRSGDRPTAAIIERYPGEDPGNDLDFLLDPRADQRIGALLPLLRCLRTVRFAGGFGRPQFTVTMEASGDGKRLDHESDALQVSGSVRDDRPRAEHMRFLARQRVPGTPPPFGALRDSASWPTSMVITESGRREPAPDKAVAEGAVMFAHADGRQGRLELQWAVFLPAEEQRFSYEAPIPGSSREYRIVLHGQFFVDAGRRGIADMDALARPVETLPPAAPQHELLRTWNQALAQQVVLPELLPVLAEHVRSFELKDEETGALTQAIGACTAGSDMGARIGFFSGFRQFVCSRHAWVRRLGRQGAAWSLVEPEVEPLLPLPAPAKSDPERPWRALPGLTQMSAHCFVDSSAPRLAAGLATWEPALLLRALKGVGPKTLRSGTDLDYLAAFLEMEAPRYVRSSEVQDHLVERLRVGLQGVELAEVRQHRATFRRIVQLLAPDRVFAIGPQDPAAKSALPEGLFRTLLAAQTRALPVPGDLGPDGVATTAGPEDLSAWLQALARYSLDSGQQSGATKTQLLDAAERVVRAAGDEVAQADLLRRNSHLRVLRSTVAGDGEVAPASLNELAAARRRGLLFRTTVPNRPLGLVPHLARALPGVQPLVVRSQVAAYVEATWEGTPARVPDAEDASALFRAVGGSDTAPGLGGREARRDLLSHAATADLGDPTVVRGVRYLLHGSAENFSRNDTLWKDPVGQKSPWVTLWRMLDDQPWKLLVPELCESIPEKCTHSLNIRAVDESSVLRRLPVCADFSGVDPTGFSDEEIDLILGRVSDGAVWLRLPLHRDRNGEYGAIDGSCFLGHGPELPVGVQHALRFIERSPDGAHYAHQKRWLTAWSASTAAATVLATDQPAAHWHYLLEVLAAAGDRPGTLPDGWKNVAWLPLENGRAIAVDSVIRLEHLDDEIRDLARQCDYAFAGLGDLDPGVRSHPRYEWLVEKSAGGVDALPILGQMTSAAGLSIGRSPRTRYREFQRHMDVLVTLGSLPAWRIVEKARAATAGSPGAVETRLVPEIASPLTVDSAQQVLVELRRLGSSPAIRDLFGVYLQEWRESAPESALRARLADLELPSAAGSWRAAGELISGISGVKAEYVLGEGLAAVLDGVAADNRGAPQHEPLDASTDGATPDADDLVDALQRFFEPLEQSSVRPAVGAVVGLFGDGAAAMAREWLKPIAYEDYLHKLGWQDPGCEESFDRRLRWMGGKTLEQALRALRIRIRVHVGQRVRAVSLTGRPVDVPLAPLDEVKTLYVKSDGWKGYFCRVHLRPASLLTEFEPQQQREVLLRTAEGLLRHLYNQQHANLSDLFALFDDADQVTLDVARTLILEGLPQSLRSLPGISRNRKLAAALAGLDEARRNAASAKRAGTSAQTADAARELALQELASLVEADAEVQASVLAGIRKRVTHNQYEIASIPFEIFQNADDAVCEMQALQQAEGRPEFPASTIGRFVMDASDRSVRFAHWGRPINYAGRHGAQRPEFGTDLERMLMLGASAKDEQEGVTGKFGLGFKSVLLATSTPRVWSGDLRFEIAAGCLPAKWKPGPSTREFHQSVHTPEQRALRCTVVELPLDARGSGSEVSGRFAALAGLLPVFSKHIRCVVVGGETHQWQPRVLRRRGELSIETGSASVPVKGGRVHSTLLVLRGSRGAAALRMGTSGIEQFDRNGDPPAPFVWVTAPTRGTPARGVLLNAAFHIDTGRASLALGASAVGANLALAEAVAEDVVPMLLELHSDSEKDWPAVAAEFGCGGSASAAGFWGSFWGALLDEAPDENAATDVSLADRFSCRLLRRVVEATGRIPNGLQGEDAALVDVGQLCLSIDLRYLRPAIPALRSWKAFVDRFPQTGWCGSEVRGWLVRSGAVEEGAVPDLDRSCVLALLKENCLPPGEVVHLSTVVEAWPSSLGEDRAWRSEMTGLLLRSGAGSWVPAGSLIRGHEDGADLLLRFAPATSVLDAAYAPSSPAFRVIEQYLQPWHRNPETVAGWCTRAEGTDARKAAVRWLLENVYSPVLDAVTARRSSGGWLFALDDGSEVLADLDTEERRLLLFKLGLSFDVQAPPLPPSILDLHAVHDWWRERGARWLEIYDSRFWPASVNREALRDDPADRTAWMTLFSLGVFRRYGRVTDQQHRGFIDFLNGRGWWHTICHVRPDEGAGAWIDILRAYGESQQTETVFEQWMDSFPRLYRIARWFDTYVHLFDTLDSRNAKSAELLLSPATDASLSGSGIEAPTMGGMLRLGQHCVVRELLRVGRLSSDAAKGLAYSPRGAVLELLSQLGHPQFGQGNGVSGRQIYELLLDELGREGACFSGAYDIPLQLIATDAQARRDAEAWADGALDRAQEEEGEDEPE